MRYLVDSNVISEPTRPSPSQRVVEWLVANESDLAIDSIVLGELSAGIRSLRAGRKRRALAGWIEQLAATIVCLPWDARVALRWGSLVAHLRAKGRAMPVLDSQIAATALVYGMTIATRNQQDFLHSGAKLTNPFDA